jgi:predicted aldo/keto reductase-like oxidoreductase
MAKHDPSKINPCGMTRRGFLTAGGAAALGAAATPALARMDVDKVVLEAGGPPQISRYRTLGRTGFKVSDVSMGCGSIAESNVVRYAYDHGINFFDTAQSYGNGDSETKIGEAMKHMERDKIFIVTKVDISEDPDEQEIVDRFNKSLERLKTPYVDAYYSHGIADLKLVEYEPFLKACATLKTEGKLRHAGISSHGPRGDEPDAMDTVLIKAAETGLFDVMLFSYGFINAEEGERVLKVCKEKHIGTTIMKSATGLMEIPVLDIENPSEQIQGWLESLQGRGNTREQAIERIKAYLEREGPRFEESLKLSKPFIEKHGIKTQDELDRKSLQWVLRNPDAHTICPSTPTFDALDKVLALSGTELSAAGAQFLDEYARAYQAYNCRFSCTECSSACPHGVPVSTIMRYAYYYRKQGREKHAMRKYARLGNQNAAVCLDCHAPCVGACPHGVQAQARLFEAHGLLTTV